MDVPQYICGTLIELTGNFFNEDGDPADPTAVTGTIRLPDLTEEDLVITLSAVGVYIAPFTPTQNGLHEYRFSGTGAIVAASEGAFTAQTVFPEEEA